MSSKMTVKKEAIMARFGGMGSVSYTHLTLPTKLEV